MRALLYVPVVLAGLVSSPIAVADCIEGMRDATAGETQYFNRVTASLKEALPAAPAGWTMVPARGDSIGSFCKGEREGDFDIAVTGTYTYKMPKEEGDRAYAEFRKVQAEIDALGQLPPAVAKERQAFLDKMSEANRAANKAEKEGNKPLARQRNDEADEFSRKGREIRERYLAGVQAQRAQLEAKQRTFLYGDVSVSVRLVANPSDSRPVNPATASEIMVGKAPARNAAGLKVQGIRAVVEGPAAKREQIRDAIDRAKLTRLLQ
jgi:hypothetical protein